MSIKDRLDDYSKVKGSLGTLTDELEYYKRKQNLDDEQCRNDLEYTMEELKKRENYIELLTGKYKKAVIALSKIASIDPRVHDIEVIIETANSKVADFQRQVDDMDIALINLRKPIEERLNKIEEFIQMMETDISEELCYLDKNAKEVEMKKNDYEMSNEELVNYLYTTEIDFGREIEPSFKPFIKHIFKLFGVDIEDDRLALNTAYTVILQILNIYSKEYIQRYITDVYSLFYKLNEKNINVIKLPQIPPPQTFQTNSLYYLLNNFNNKLYEPGVMNDYSDYIYKYLRGEYRSDTTPALNVFQSGGKRYNSILIYTDETREILEKRQSMLKSFSK